MRIQWKKRLILRIIYEFKKLLAKNLPFWILDYFINAREVPEIIRLIADKNAFFKLECSGDPETIFAYTTFSEGTYTYYHTITTAFDRLNFVPLNTSTGGSFSIDNISVKEVGQHWTFGTDWKFDGDKPYRDTTGTSPLYQSAGLIIGRTYKVTFDLVSVTASGIRPYVGGAGTGTLRTSVGTYSFLSLSASCHIRKK